MITFGAPQMSVIRGISALASATAAPLPYGMRSYAGSVRKSLNESASATSVNSATA